MAFNENTRVKIPAILHLIRMGYTYLPLSKAKWDVETNIFTDIFSEAIKRINLQATKASLVPLLSLLKLITEGIYRHIRERQKGEPGSPMWKDS